MTLSKEQCVLIDSHVSLREARMLKSMDVADSCAVHFCPIIRVLDRSYVKVAHLLLILKTMIEKVERTYNSNQDSFFNNRNGSEGIMFKQLISV